MNRASRGFRIFASGVLIALSFVGGLARADQALAAQDIAPSSNQALVLLTPAADISATTEAIERAGGHVTHIFPPVALIAEVPHGVKLPTDRLAVHRQMVDEAVLATFTYEERRAAQVWNALLAPKDSAATAESLDTLGTELASTAMVAPPSEEIQIQSADPTPGYAETSEYFIGRDRIQVV